MPDYREYNAKERRYRSIKRTFRRVSIMLATVVMILSVSAVITAVIEAPAKRKAASLAASKAAFEAAQLASSRAELLGEVGFIGPAPQAKDAITLTPITGSLITMPQNGRVDMSYFTDALFIGDSLTHGFEVYSSGIKEAKYAAYVGATPQMLISGKVKKEDGTEVVAMDEIVAAAPKKAYILLGTNALASSQTDDAIIKYYNDLLDTLKSKLGENIVYYIQGMPPISASAEKKGLTNERINTLNERIAKMAYERGYHYIDLHSVFAADDGLLRGDLAAGDGLHFNGAGYAAWKEYLITHTAYDKTSMYIAGSPFYLG